jgi:hypothetical protein
MATAFAEEGSWKTAEQLMDELNISLGRSQPKLLFASVDQGFSPNVIDYTVNLAERMKLDILAVNIFQPGRAHSRIGNQISQGDKKQLQHLLDMQNLLMSKAKEMDLRCNQALLKGNLRTAIGKFSRMIRRIELVIIQRNWDKDPLFKLDVPVYMVTPR